MMNLFFGVGVVVQDLLFVYLEIQTIHAREFFDIPVDPSIASLPGPGLGLRNRVFDRDVDEKVIVFVEPDALEHA